MIRIDPCLKCSAMNLREHTTPQPTRCLRCGAPLVVKPPAPTLVERTRAFSLDSWS